MLAILLRCPHCQMELKTGQDEELLLGRRIKCRKCGERFKVRSELIVPATPPQSTSAVPIALPFAPPEVPFVEVEETPLPRKTAPRKPVSELAVVAAPEPTAPAQGTTDHDAAAAGEEKSSQLRDKLTTEPAATHPPKTVPVSAARPPRYEDRPDLLVAAAILIGLFLMLGTCTAILCYALWPTTEAQLAVLDSSAAMPTAAEITPAPSEAPVAEPAPVPVPVPPPTAAVKKVPAPAQPDGPKEIVLDQDYQIPVAASTLVSAQQRQVNDTIEKGIAYLKSTQDNNGSWGGGSHEVGYTALPALALLECGVPATADVLQKAANRVRFQSGNQRQTYDLALAILFLDRLGNKHDDPLIRELALRLVAGQHANGGWSYSCPVPDQRQRTELMMLLQATKPLPLRIPLENSDLAMNKPLAKGKPLPTPIQEPGELLPTLAKKDETAAALPQPLPRENDSATREKPQFILPFSPAAAGNPAAPEAQPTTTSPSQKPPDFRYKNFPLQRLSPDVRSLPIVNYRPSLQHKLDSALPEGSSDNSNTQFAIMALWAARRHGVPVERSLALAEQRFRTSQMDDGGWGYQYRRGSSNTMTAVGLIGLAMGHGICQEIMAGSVSKEQLVSNRDPLIQRGLQYLGQHVGAAPKDWNAPAPAINLYFLWSVERVAMLYDLKTIGGQDWYAWAAHSLVRTQDNTGAWQNGGGYHGAHPIINTSFALLVLKRANLVQDLTDSLRLYIPITDPASGR